MTVDLAAMGGTVLEPSGAIDGSSCSETAPATCHPSPVTRYPLPATRHPRAVELFGVPRLLTGERMVAARGETLGDVAIDLGERYPVLIGRVLDAERRWLLPGYSFVVGDRFSRDPALVLADGAPILLVASAAGG